MKRTLAAGYILLAIAVLIGAFGAHGLEGKISDRYMETYHTANFYHFIHGLGLIISSYILHAVGSKRAIIVSNLFVLGIILFSGSLYLLSLNEYFETPGLKMLGAITPVGGLLFVAAWILGAYEITRIRWEGPDKGNSQA